MVKRYLISACSASNRQRPYLGNGAGCGALACKGVCGARLLAGARCWLLVVSLSLVACSRNSEPPDLAIWRIVDQSCNAAKTSEPQSGPRQELTCDSQLGYAILKDRCGPTHYLLIPTARRTGVESPELEQAGEPNYFALAWEERRRSATAEGAAPGDADVGLAINSRYGRSQSQLHIHIDWLRPEVRTALRALQLPLAADTQLELMGHRYRVEHLDSLNLSPFALVASEWGARTQEDRARLTLAVAGDGGSGFFLLSDRADLAALDRGHAEELLLAHSCRKEGT
ncbi:MAG TPA: CDP-diacylglycerol diphosphatase [Burkholderiaceae bacterium]|nr:CDP-diacylglycerol diphosphatase [Burkholderiaceae bacterium]